VNPAAGIAASQIIKRRLFEFLDVPLPIELLVLDERGRKLREHWLPARQSVTDARSIRQITMVMVCVLGVMVISFNMFSVLFSEEKANRTLLAQLLSPASCAYCGPKCSFSRL
jgi:hypothetical protein